MKSKFLIQGMDCSAEEQVIKNRFGKVEQVTELEFDLVNRILTVTHEYDSDLPIRTVLKEIGLPPEEDCDVGCAPDKRDIGRADIALGVAFALAILAEVVAYSTGNERSLPVLGLSLAAIGLGGVATFKKGLVAVKTLTLNINFLMCIAVVGAFVIGSYPEAAMVTVLFAIAERIESFALERARNAVKSLMTLAPETAFVFRDGVWLEVDAATVSLGERLRVRPGDRIPLDGLVLSGESSVDQAPITGESVPVDKVLGDQLFAGTINGEGMLEFTVTGSKGNTTLDRIIRTVQEAQGSRAPTQRFIDTFARYYTPIVVLIALLVAVVPSLFGQPFLPWLYKALVLLVIACPCALVISTPVTVVSGLAAAARRGILIKGGVHLESGKNLTLIALDKTGTLTHGEPKVTQVVTLHDYEESLVRQVAATLDSTSAHPIAKAIVGAWEGELLAIEKFESLTGRGVAGDVGGAKYYLGNHRLIEEKGICCDHVHDAIGPIERDGKSLVLLANEKEVMAVFAVADTVRQESIEAVRKLHDLGLKVMMLTGDNEATAQAIGAQVGIDQIQAEMLPEHKLVTIQDALGRGERVGMVGDGVNDAPALAASTVGFAMGAAGTDTAIETADVALMDDDLRKLPEYIQLSRRTSAILTQNIVIALLIKFVFFALAMTGTATLWMAVFADMGASLLVVGNGLRILRTSSRKEPTHHKE
jgi:Cd2+/Zn2+-exporting ATPase